jgi:DUF971 family protein
MWLADILSAEFAQRVTNPLAAQAEKPVFRSNILLRSIDISPMRLEPTNVQQIGEELAIVWNDGTESFFKLETLRRACPCAACGGEPDVLGNVSRPHVTYTEKSFQLVGFDLVGGYALQPRWADGHGSGIYSFTYLRRLGQASG